MEPSEDYVKACKNRMAEVVGPKCTMALQGSDLLIASKEGLLEVRERRLGFVHVLRQTVWGRMKSGWQLTISMNSFAQFAQHVVAMTRMQNYWRQAVAPLPQGSLPRIWVMGDDILLSYPYSDDRYQRSEFLKSYQEATETLGCIVKHVRFGREFAGFSFEQAGPVPLYKNKHIESLKWAETELEETLLAYMIIYCFVPDYGWVGQYARQLQDFVPQHTLKLWAQGLLPKLPIRKFAIPTSFLDLFPKH